MIVKKFMSSAVLAAAVGCASAPKPVEPPKPIVEAPKVEVKRADPLASGNEAFVAKQYDKAVAAYDEFLKKEPKHAQARFNRALALQELGRNDEAEAAYADLISDEPKYSDAVINLGVVFKNKGSIDKGISVYESYLKGEPFDSRVLNNLASLYREKKDYGKAIQAVRKLLMRDKNNIDAYKNLALVYFDQKKLKLTQTILENARTMAKTNGVKDPDISVNMGLTYLALGDNGRAMAAFKDALALDDNHPLANFNVAALALTHRDYDLAAKGFKIAADRWPNDFEITASLGFAYQGLGNLPEAEKLLRKALEMKRDENVLMQLGVVLQSAERVDEAIKVLEDLVASKGMTCGPQDFDGLCGRINGLQMMKKMKEAPPAEEEKPKATGDVDKIFNQPEGGEAPAEGGDAPAEGGAAPAEGGAAPAPAEGGAPPAQPTEAPKGQ